MPVVKKVTDILLEKIPYDPENRNLAGYFAIAVGVYPRMTICPVARPGAKLRAETTLWMGVEKIIGMSSSMVKGRQCEFAIRIKSVVESAASMHVTAVESLVAMLTRRRCRISGPFWPKSNNHLNRRTKSSS